MSSFVLTLDDVLITSQDISGWALASEGDTTVALDLPERCTASGRHRARARQPPPKPAQRPRPGRTGQGKRHHCARARHGRRCHPAGSTATTSHMRRRHSQLSVAEALPDSTALAIEGYEVQVSIVRSTQSA